MNKDIDIVITYVTDTDDNWIKDYNYYKNIEIESGIQKKSNRQAFGKERSRDWEFLPYWFRSVEKNCPWVRYIWFVCQRESQVPKWLNKDNPKLRIIYHNQFIPQEFLPTFNPMIIKSFLFNITDLADNFIESSDDMFFVGNIPQDMFFINNRPVDKFIIHDFKHKEPENTAFDSIIINKNNFLHNIYNKDYKYYFHHLPLARNKQFEKNFYLKYKDVIDKSLIISKFRHPKNLIWHMYTDAMKFEGITINKDIFVNSIWLNLKGNTINIKLLNNKDIIVINDTEFITDFDNIKTTVLHWFQTKFSNMSSFEMYDCCKKNLMIKSTANNKSENKAKLPESKSKKLEIAIGLSEEWWKDNNF